MNAKNSSEKRKTSPMDWAIGVGILTILIIVICNQGSTGNVAPAITVAKPNQTVQNGGAKGNAVTRLSLSTEDPHLAIQGGAVAAKVEHWMKSLLEEKMATHCVPAYNADGITLMVLCEGPVLQVPDAKKAVMLVAVGAVGKTVNDCTAVQFNKVAVGDPTTVETQQYWIGSAYDCASWQREAEDNKLSIEGMAKHIDAAFTLQTLNVAK
jgi:hypothetical protein